ncbi:MAG: MFS transporter [Sulfobacillus acidophilus]|uniref:MFS transporter n=1 Tax=Sulfobacillus acidophilus TaxID=53633 RepID=A0A2T2WFC2_9FIRM|nr:MAG: MFS transporter [Sulfobacillus acidophilus]
MTGLFINRVGNSLVFPFMTIYLASRLHAPMTIIGLVMTLYGLSQVAAQLVGGVLTDLWGRRPVMLLALASGGVFTLAVGLAHTDGILIAMLVLMGLSVPLFQPASMTMVGDLVPSAKLSQAYGLMRMASNAGIIIGPMLGGFLADYSFLLVFGLDALSMLIFFVIIVVGIHEPPRRRQEPTLTTPTGLRELMQDRPFLLFSTLWGLTGMVYAQLYQVVPAYLHLDLHFPVSAFGYLAAENAVLVVVLQLPITRLVGHVAPARLMALGSLFYGAGFVVMLTGRSFLPFTLGVVIITLGENVMNPAASTWVVNKAPEKMRGRYLGLFGLANRTGSAIGPTIGGSLLTVGASFWLLSTGAIGAAVAGAFWLFAGQEEKMARHINSSLDSPL